MDYTTIASEFLRPLVNGWINKIESATSSKDRLKWKESADECKLFYSNSAQAMWDPSYSKKFWKGIKLPRFRVTINKAFEFVAINMPGLLWDVPHRTVQSRRQSLPMELIGQDPQMLQMMQQAQQEDEVISALMGSWLNYTPGEQPGGGLTGHSEKATLDTLITGRGVLAPRPYQMPGSGRTLTGSFRVNPYDIFTDPDFDTLDECSWMAIKHIDIDRDVEERFELPKGSLKGKATLESSWTGGEEGTGGGAHKIAGKTNDLVVWYEIFSKAGVGIRNTNMEATIRDHLDSVVGQHAYIAVCADVPYPLNMPSEKIRKSATDDEVKDAFKWPVPFWADDRWPVEFNEFYLDTDSAYPVPPLAPGLGELKLLNFLFSWFANRTWSSSRDFWAVSHPYLEHYKEYILGGDDQSIIPTPIGIKSPKEAVEILTQPESRQDMTQLISFVLDLFEKRVGMTPGMYGQNEGGTQNRTAEETIAKKQALNIRPEHMQKRTVDWQSRVAASEAFVARWFVGPEDVEAFMGPVGAMLWQQYVQSTDIELVVRQFDYTISAASIRRPDRDRDIGNYQQVMSQFAPVLAQYGAESGNYEPWNGMVSRWGELHDARLDKLLLPSNQPSEEEAQMQQQLQQQAQQLELAKLQAEVQKITAEAQSKQVDAQMKPVELQAEIQSQQQSDQMALMAEQLKQRGEMMKLQGEQQKQAGEAAKMQLDVRLKADQARTAQQQAMLDLVRDDIEHQQEMEQDEEKHEMEMEQMREKGKLDLQLKRAAQSKNGSAAQ